MTALRIGGLVPFSSVDWPGQFAAVVFVQGCPWRCAYCHNPHLQSRRGLAEGRIDWPGFLTWLRLRKGLLDGVVFSGGEPTVDAALPAAMADVHALGFHVGLHTAGMYPQRLQALLPLLDWVGLDVKAPLADNAAHARITGVPQGQEDVAQSLALLAGSAVAFECRTTAHPQLLDEAALITLADQMTAAGAHRWVLQIYRDTGCAHSLEPVGPDYPSAATLAQLQARAPGFSVRRH